MKNKRPVILIVTGILLAVLVWFLTVPPPPPPQAISIEHQRMISSRLQAQLLRMQAQAGSLVIEAPWRMPHLVVGRMLVSMPTNGQLEDTNEILVDVPVIDPKYSEPTNWPVDPRPEVQAIYAFAQAAKPYKFDPQVNATKVSASARDVGFFDTATHMIDVDKQTHRLIKFASKLDRLGSQVVYTDADTDWSEATGQWNQQQMIDETLRIVRELGPTYTDTLQAVSHGRSTFKAHWWNVKTAGGEMKTIYPFATVKLFGPDTSGNPNEPPRVTAQFRMGATGPVGLVDWFSIY